MEWTVTQTPDDPSLNPCWVGEADDALDALDKFADAEGFALYSELLADPESYGATTAPEDVNPAEVRGNADPADPSGEWVGDVQTNGSRWAIFTNTTVWAMPLDDGLGRAAFEIGKGIRAMLDEWRAGESCSPSELDYVLLADEVLTRSVPSYIGSVPEGREFVADVLAETMADGHSLLRYSAMAGWLVTFLTAE